MDVLIKDSWLTKKEDVQDRIENIATDMLGYYTDSANTCPVYRESHLIERKLNVSIYKWKDRKDMANRYRALNHELYYKDTLEASLSILKEAQVNMNRFLDIFSKEMEKTLNAPPDNTIIKDLMANIIAIIKTYGQMRYKRGQIYVMTPMINLEGYDFDRFEIRHTLGCHGNENVVTIKKFHKLKNENYIHPHVRANGIMCFGEAWAAVNNAAKEMRYVDLIDLVCSILSVYNPKDPLTRIDNFRPPIICQHEGPPKCFLEKIFTCVSCAIPLCVNHAYPHKICGSMHCLECLKKLEICTYDNCNESICVNCGATCHTSINVDVLISEDNSDLPRLCRKRVCHTHRMLALKAPIPRSSNIRIRKAFCQEHLAPILKRSEKAKRAARTRKINEAIKQGNLGLAATLQALKEKAERKKEDELPRPIPAPPPISSPASNVMAGQISTE